jgi:uncharacterized protein YndB with AHSA1/START domain
MEATSQQITVQVSVKASPDKAWDYFTQPEHVTQWYHASDDWHAPRAENDLKPGGKFVIRMEAKDGSAGFDFEGNYTDINPKESIEYAIADGRKVLITFKQEGDQVTVTEIFDAENVHAAELQRGGWQAILDNYKKYAEQH